jgi:hypothetical protein
MIKKTKFTIEKIDLEQGLCSVRHINPYGPVESEEISAEDAAKQDNPNHDILATFNIPLQNYEFISPEMLVDYISKCYPSSSFEDYLIMKLADTREDLYDLVGKTFEKDIEVPEEISLGGLLMTQFDQDSGIEVSTL